MAPSHSLRLAGKASVTAGRLAYVPAKRGAEGARRAVADAFGDLVDSKVVAAEQVLRDGHAPGEQVFHRRQSHADGKWRLGSSDLLCRLKLADATRVEY